VSLNTFAQTDMYNGIKSGIRRDEFSPKWHRTEINNETYYVVPHLKDGRLVTLTMFSKKKYKKVSQIEKDIDKLVLTLYDTYGFPMLVDDRGSEILRNIFIFQKDSLLVDLSVLIKDDGYYIYVIIIDRKFVKDNYY
jgi:hypothetical protein